MRKSLSCRSMLRNSIYDHEGTPRFEEETFGRERWVRPRRKVRHWTRFRDACRGLQYAAIRLSGLYGIIIKYPNTFLKFNEIPIEQAV